MAKLLMTGKGKVSEITDICKKAVMSTDKHCKLIDSVNHQYSAYSVDFMFFEKSYGKTANKVYCTVLVSGANDVVVVDANAPECASAASMLSRYSWGQDEDYICVLARTLESIGFANS